MDLKKRTFPLPVRVNGTWLWGAKLPFLWRGHEREVYHAIRRTVTPQMRVADVGACFGAHTAALLAKTNNVVAFEPDRHAFKYLHRNFPHLNIVLHPVSNKSQLLKMNFQYGVSSISEDGTPVSSVTLASYGHFDFVKIDAEGHDLEVIEGLDRSKETKLIFEFSPKQLASPQAFLDHLRVLSVKYFFLTEDGRPVELPDAALIEIAGTGHINLFGIARAV